MDHVDEWNGADFSEALQYYDDSGEAAQLSAYYKYDLTLRERDEDGDLYKTGKACSLRVIPQFSDLNYKDGSPLTLQYGEGSLVRCSTTWADTADEVVKLTQNLYQAYHNGNPKQVEPSG